LESPLFVQVFVVGLLAAVSPGPDFVVLTRNSLAFGRAVGIATALGIATGLLIHVSYTVLGFAVVLQQRPDLFRWLQFLGAAYLAWLGWHAVRSQPVKDGDAAVHPVNEDKSVSAGYRDGFLCNALNPKATLFFLSIFAQFLTPGTPPWVQWAYGMEVVVAAGGWFVVLATMVSSPAFRATLRRQQHWIDRLLGAVLLYFAARIVWTELVG
jgi:RhtB (resistance to homoserine/threonine) family protein